MKSSICFFMEPTCSTTSWGWVFIFENVQKNIWRKEDKLIIFLVALHFSPFLWNILQLNIDIQKSVCIASEMNIFRNLMRTIMHHSGSQAIPGYLFWMWGLTHLLPLFLTVLASQKQLVLIILECQDFRFTLLFYWGEPLQSLLWVVPQDKWALFLLLFCELLPHKKVAQVLIIFRSVIEQWHWLAPFSSFLAYLWPWALLQLHALVTLGQLSSSSS